MKDKLRISVVAALVLVTVLALSTGCESPSYTQTIKITAETEGVNGLLARIEYYQNSKLVSSINLIDGNGDSIIDGRAGPAKAGQWPEGWKWFDEMYNDVVVGNSTLEVVGGKIKIQTSTTYELLPGEYECGRVG